MGEANPARPRPMAMPTYAPPWDCKIPGNFYRGKFPPGILGEYWEFSEVFGNFGNFQNINSLMSKRWVISD